MRIRHRLRRGDIRKRRAIVIISLFATTFFLASGYAAFSTVININAKGNLVHGATITPADLIAPANIVTSGDGLYVDSSDSGRYVYKGANPSNYLSLNNETWRIMSVESDYTLKIIREDSIGTIAFDPGSSTVIDGITTSGSTVGTRSSSTSTNFCYATWGYNGCKLWGSSSTIRNSSGTLLQDTNDGAIMPRSYATSSTTYSLPSDEAYLNVYLNGGTYAGNNITGWYTTWSSGLSNSVKSYILSDHAYNVGLLESNSGELTSVNVTQEKTYTWRGRVGLMTASEYVRASTNTACTGVYAYRNTSGCYNNGSTHNYLTKSANQWTITPDSYTNIYPVWDGTSGALNVYNAGNTAIVRPVLYLSSSVELEGEGTESEKYEIA